MVPVFSPATSVSFCGCLFVRREGERCLLALGGAAGRAELCGNVCS